MLAALIHSYSFECSKFYGIISPLQTMVDVAKEVGADAVAHGCTGKGNDQVVTLLACILMCLVIL